MRTVDPNMNTDKQFREAFKVRERAVATGDIQKSTYIDYLIWLMAHSIACGTPRPWSEFEPMLDEEFHT